MPQQAEKIRWARKVRQAKIWQLYQTDARGAVDETLIDEVGGALHDRCQSILLVSRGAVFCPRCGRIFTVGRSRPQDEIIPCPEVGCGWQTTPAQYHRSWRHQDLISGWAKTTFETFVAEWSYRQPPAQKMILIDQLIHAFHQGLIGDLPHRSVANNLIEGSHRQVLELLDRLAYGIGSTAGLKETHRRWQGQVEQMWRVRRGQT